MNNPIGLPQVGRVLAPERAALAQRYDHAAKHYDRLADILFERFLNVERHRESLVAMLGNLEGAHVVDVGCGTGRNFSILHTAIGPHGRLTGIDCSHGMLQQAARRVDREGWRNVELVNDDAVELTSIRHPVDALVSAWCYGEVMPLRPALERALAIIRPGGSFAIMSFAEPRPARGRLRWLYPACRVAARCVGVDTNEVLDNRKVAAKWTDAVAFLSERLDGLQVARYAGGALLAIAGRTPAAMSPRSCV
jgi:S-adenosylmethionine-diacylgycerolhomoserine-N-methlytransferase